MHALDINPLKYRLLRHHVLQKCREDWKVHNPGPLHRHPRLDNNPTAYLQAFIPAQEGGDTAKQEVLDSLGYLPGSPVADTVRPQHTATL